jgi:hypothetical protein
MLMCVGMLIFVYVYYLAPPSHTLYFSLSNNIDSNSISSNNDKRNNNSNKNNNNNNNINNSDNSTTADINESDCKSSGFYYYDNACHICRVDVWLLLIFLCMI